MPPDHQEVRGVPVRARNKRALLDSEEERTVAQRLAGPDMNSGCGLRTMSSTSVGYWPLRYHGGSVGAHDTAIAITGLARSGHTAVAAQLVEGLLAAGEALGYRLPELYSGDPRSAAPTVVPYPAACRPQAWSAAAAVALLSASSPTPRAECCDSIRRRRHRSGPSRRRA